MSEMPLFQSLSSAALISLVLVAVLSEPTTIEPKENASPARLAQASQQVELKQPAAPAMEATPETPDHEALQTQIAALVLRIESLEAKLQAQNMASTLEPVPDFTRMQSPQYADTASQPDLEALWVGQPNNPDWEVRVENNLIHLATETKELGLGQTELSKADCRGDLCQLSINSAIPAAMLQHLLTRYVGNIRKLEADVNSQGSYSVFVQQTN